MDNSNLAIRNFRNTLMNYIDNTDIAWEAKRLVLAEISAKVNEVTEQAIAYEIENTNKIEEVKNNGELEH